MLTPARFVPYEMKSSLIRVTSYENKTLQGVFINSFYENEMRFENLIQLLFLMEKLQDELSFPQKAMEQRTFTGTKEHQAETAAQQGSYETLATFKVNVLFRQNASWQGSVQWVERESESQFRSVLELVMLIDSVLTA
jgi:hypothetical protein